MDQLLSSTFDLTAINQTEVSIYRYIAMFLSVIGLVKTNFLVSTFFHAPNAAYAVSQTDQDLTDSLITSLETIRDGLHSFASSLNIVSTFVPDSTQKLIDYSPQFHFSMFTASLFLQSSLLALVFKYMTTALLLGVSFVDVLKSFLDMVLIGMVPDFLITTVPLYLSYLRVYELQYA